MVRITEDKDSDMLRIENEGKCLFYGNCWDFDRSGENFKRLFQAVNVIVELEQKPYEEWDYLK